MFWIIIALAGLSVFGGAFDVAVEEVVGERPVPGA